MMKRIFAKFIKIAAACFCLGLPGAGVVAAQCGPDGMQRCPQRNAPGVTQPVVKIKSTAASKPVLPGPRTRVNVKNAKAEAAAKIAEAEKFYDYAVRGCDDADIECKIKNFTRAIELNRRYAEAYAYRGYAYTRVEKREAAVRDFTRAVELDPRDADSFYNRGVIHSTLKNPEAALRDFTKAIELKPNYTDAYVNRAMLFESRQQYTAALNDYNRAIAATPNVFGLYYFRGLLYQNYLGNDAAALSDFTTVTGYSPRFSLPYYYMAKIMDKKGDYQTAIGLFTKSISLSLLESAPPHIDRGWSYMKAGDNQAALKDFNQAVAIDPGYAYAYYSRAYFYSNALKQQDAAIRDYTKAIELSPHYAQAYHNRGAVYHVLGDNDRALRDYTAAIQHKPDYAQAYQNRALLYRRLSLMSLAVEDEKKYAQLTGANR